MGNIVPTLGERSQDMQVILQTEFPEYLHIDQIGKGKFMKTHTVKRVSRDTSKGTGGVATVSDDTFVGIGDKAVVKIYLKRTDRGGEVNKRIALVREQLAQLCRTFNLYHMPNIVPYQRFEDNTRNDAAFLIRQHFMYNLYDRLNTRPFLTLIEKKWLIFQLLKAVQQIHDAEVRHGDIKSENIMVTSWGWLLLTDFAVFKPTFIPEDHPADFYYFFEAGTRRRCYIAPERLVKEKDLEKHTMSYVLSPPTAELPTSPIPAAPPLASTPGGQQACDPALTRAMDLFAAGCVIAEIVLDGEPILELSGLLRYKTSTDFDPLASEGVSEAFREVDGSGQLRAMVATMLDRTPAQRLAADALVAQNTASFRAADVAAPSAPKVFPAYFPYLFSFLSRLVTAELQTPDARVLAVCAHYGEMVHTITGGVCDPQGEQLMKHRLTLEPGRVQTLVSFPLTDGFATVKAQTSAEASVRAIVGKYSIDAQCTSAAVNELSWEWGWGGSDAWGDGFMDLSESSCQMASLHAQSPFELHRPWRPFRSVDDLSPGTTNAVPPVQATGVTKAAQKVKRQVLHSSSDRLSSLLDEANRVLDMLSSEAEVIPACTSDGDVQPLVQQLAPLYQVETPQRMDVSGMAVVLTLLTSSLRHLSNPRTKLTALLLISRFAAFADDESRLQRVVPFVMTQLTDSSPVVRSHAAYCLTSTLEAVRSFPASDALLFPQYVFQPFARLLSDGDTCVQLAAAECMPRLAVCSKRFLEISQWKTQATALRRAVQVATSAAIPPSTKLSSTSSPVHRSSSIVEDIPLSLSLGSPMLSPQSNFEGTHVKVRSHYDHELDATHKRIQSLIQKWLVSTAQNATTAVASAGVEKESLDAADQVLVVPPSGQLPLFSPGVLYKFSQALGQLSSSSDASLAKRMLLQHAVHLCTFFGRTETEDFFLPILITFLSDPTASTIIASAGTSLISSLVPASACADAKLFRSEEVLAAPFTSATLLWLSRSQLGSGDWLLKDAFLKQLVKISSTVGPYNIQHNLLPFIEQGISDVNETIVHQALMALSQLILSHLLPHQVGPDLLRRYACLVLHPSQWARVGAFCLIASVWLSLGWPKCFIQTAAFVNPILRADAGDICWRHTKAMLLEPLAANSKVTAIVGMLSTCTVHYVTKIQFDRECHKVVMGVVRSTSAPLASLLRAPSAAKNSEGPLLSPGGVYSSTVSDLGVASLSIGPTSLFHAKGENLEDDFSDGEDDDDDSKDVLSPTSGPEQKPAEHADPEPSLFNTPGFAPAFPNSVARRAYCADKLRSFISSVGGPHRISVQAAVRLSLHSGADPSADMAESTHVSGKTPRLLASDFASEFHVMRALSGHLIPDLPYSADEVCDIPVHSVSVPDQRYASMHPAPARSIIGRTPNPQDEVRAVGRHVVLEGDVSVYEWQDGHIPTIKLNDLTGRMLSQRGLHELHAHIPAWRHARAASAPLPTDYALYMQAMFVSGKHAATVSKAVPGASFVVPKLARAYDSVAQGQDRSVSTATSKNQIRSTIRSSYPLAASSFDDQIRGAGSGPATPSPSAFLRSLRKDWRKAGRRARKVYLKYGVWDPMLITEGSSSLQQHSGVGTANAFFYGKNDSQDDPSLLSSDEEAQVEGNKLSTASFTDVAEAAGLAIGSSNLDMVADSSQGDIGDFELLDNSGDVAPSAIFADLLQDTRLTPAIIAARYSSAAQHAITASDSAWLIQKLNAWATAAGIQLPQVASVTNANTAERAAVLGPNSIVSAAASQRYEMFQRRRVHRRVRPIITLKPNNNAVASELGDDFVFAGDGDLTRRTAAGTGSARKPGLYVAKGSRGIPAFISNVMDGSFIQLCYEAEITMAKEKFAMHQLQRNRIGARVEQRVEGDRAAPQGDGSRPTKEKQTSRTGSDNRDFLAPEAAEALQLRMEALGVPPLPPNLGFLSKASDPPAPIVSHAVRVAVGISAPDSLSSVAPGVGGGGLGNLASNVSKGFALSLDESITFGPIEAKTSEMVKPPLRPILSAAQSEEAYEIVSMSSDGTTAQLGASHPHRATEIVAVPQPIPLTEDIARPGDVGDGTGYIGSGHVSFVGVERGWRDAVGVAGPQNTGASDVDHDVTFSSYTAQETARNAHEAAQADARTVGGANIWDGSDGSWGSRPKGVLLCTFAEHTGAINALAGCQDHSFVASGSDDGTVKIWDTKHLGRSGNGNALLTYTGHLQESRHGDAARGLKPGRNRVTDAVVCDNSSSVASGSSAGTVHVFRVDMAAARVAGRGGYGAPAVTIAEYISPTGNVFEDVERKKNTRGSFVGALRSASMADTTSDAADDDAEGFHAVSKEHIRVPEGISLIRRLVFDAEEGSVTAIRHYQNATQSVLAVATSGGVLHGCDLRARVEAWAIKIPAALGCLTSMEICPGSTSCVLGTDRGVVAVYDLRFNFIVCAWRHSSRSSIKSLYPYVTLAVRDSAPSAVTSQFSAERTDTMPQVIPVARELAVGIATGENEVSFWNMETGVCTRLLRALPSQIHAGDAYRVPFLTRISIVNGRVATYDAAILNHDSPCGPAALGLAAHELRACRPAPSPIRCLMCPLPTSMQPIMLPGSAGDDISGASGSIRSETTGAIPAGVGFVLGGLRGAGATRRRDQPFAVGYAIGSHSAEDVYSQSDIGYVYGGSPLEGLPVWMLTAGDDRLVRCWDLDRPRASHTVVGLKPGEVRDGYEGAWIVPNQSAPEGDEDEGENEPAGDAQTEKAELRVPKHFLVHLDADGISASSKHDPRVPVLASSRNIRHAYACQGENPIRAILAQSLYDPSKEQDVMGSGGVSAHPSLLMRGPVPPSTAHDSSVTTMAWLDSPARLLVTGAADGVIKIWR